MSAASSVAKMGGKKIWKAIRTKLAVTLSPVFAIFLLVTVVVLSIFSGADQAAQAAQQCNSSVTAGSYVENNPKAWAVNQSVVDIVYAVGKQRGVSDRGMLAAFETAFVESTFANLASAKVPESSTYPHDFVAPGDSSSVGVFQQLSTRGETGRDGKEWGTIQQLMDPAHSAGKFFDSLAAREPFNDGKTAGQWAQDVQRSGFPLAYDQAETEARKLLDEAAARAASTAAAPPVAGATPGQNSLGIKQADGAKWVWPAGEGTISSPFGMRGGKLHGGTDFAIPIGTPVPAAMSGTVVRSTDSATGYGTAIYIDHGDGTQTRYGHGSQRLVQVNDTVTAGQTIMLSGNSGQSSGPHVHFEVRKGNAASLDNGATTPQDPIPFLKSNGAIIASGDPAAGAAGGTAACSSVDGSLVDPGVGPMNENNYTPRAQNLRDLTATRWGCDTGVTPCVKTIGGYRTGGPNPNSDHHTGNAVDIMIGPGGYPTGADKEMGGQIAKFYTDNAASLGINYIIWEKQIWFTDTGKWKEYTGGSGGGGAGGPTLGHWDHLHISVKKS